MATTGHVKHQEDVAQAATYRSVYTVLFKALPNASMPTLVRQLPNFKPIKPLLIQYLLGFDAIATSGEEVHNPKKNIPLAIVITVVTVATCFIGVSFVLTVMVPYYIIDINVAVAQAFNYVDLGSWAQPIVTVGAMISIVTR